MDRRQGGDSGVGRGGRKKGDGANFVEPGREGGSSIYESRDTDNETW
jgi:hypothetical protein